MEGDWEEEQQEAVPEYKEERVIGDLLAAVRPKNGLPKSVPMPKPSKENDRLTITLRVHHEHRGEPPSSAQYIHAKLLETNDQQTYSMRIKADCGWVRLDKIAKALNGWFTDDKLGYLILENLEGRAEQTKPSKEEKERIKKRVVEVGFCNDGMPAMANGFRIPPGDFAMIQPNGIMYLCCQSETAVCRLTIFPR